MCMKKGSKVFLFGAGAMIPWSAPTTTDLTDVVLRSGFKIRGVDITITRFIYDKLLERNHTADDINFETIINVIEEFIIYYSYSNTRKKTDSLLSCFFLPEFEEQLLNFSVTGSVPNHNYRLQIPEGQDYNFSNS